MSPEPHLHEAAAIATPSQPATLKPSGRRRRDVLWDLFAPEPTVKAAPALWVRLVIASAAAVLAGLLADHPLSEDFSQIWVASRTLLEGGDPYALIGPNRPHSYPFPYYYPGTAAVSVLPLAALPVRFARIMFAAGGAAVFALMLTRSGWSRLPWLASYAFLSCLYVSQWTTWVAAAGVYPVLGFVLAAKPNAGIAALATLRSLRALVGVGTGCLVVALFALALDPDWPLRWRETTQSAPHIRSLLFVHPAGVILLASLIRWRRPEARALAALAIVPHNPLPHNFLLLAVGRWTAIESSVLAALSWVTVAVIWPGGRQSPDFTSLSETSGRACLFLLYLPALLMMLRKPNSDEARA